MYIKHEIRFNYINICIISSSYDDYQTSPKNSKAKAEENLLM